MKIKFSHKYKKLISEAGFAQQATLLDVVPINLEDMSKPFLDYDTDEGKYELPKKGKFLMLIFDKGNGLFTTIRRATDAKEQYYRSAIGLLFDIEITDGKD